MVAPRGGNATKMVAPLEIMPSTFQPYDVTRPVRIYRRRLPHWRQDGATYFVTSRLYDSLPEHLLAQLDRLRQVFLETEPRDDAFLHADREYYRKMAHYLGEEHGSCWLKDPRMQELVLGAFHHFDGTRYELGERAALPNHVHVLVRPLPGFELEDILHSWKSFTAKQINKHAGRTGPVWQKESYDRLVRDSLELQRTERYIRNNVLPPDQREQPW